MKSPRYGRNGRYGPMKHKLERLNSTGSGNLWLGQIEQGILHPLFPEN